MGTVHAKSMSREEADNGGEILLDKVPVKVEKVHVHGLTRTRNDIIVKHLQDVFKASNFEEMVKRSQEAKCVLESLGLFKDIIIAIDTSKGESSRKDGYEVTFRVAEQRRVTGGVSTMVGTNEGSVLFNMKSPNSFGRGEKINVEYSYGTKNAVGFGVNFNKPLQGDPKLNFQAGASQYTGDYPWSGYREVDRGVQYNLSFPTLLGSHVIGWEGVWRELSCLNNSTAFSVREHGGHSLKSGLRHTLTVDTRDSAVLPSTGHLLRLTQEIAGLGGDVNFLKVEKELQLNKQLPLDSVLQVSLAGGMMKPIRPGSELKLPDRFFIGGPLTLRGFNIKGAGPHSDGCAMGADTYWLAAAHLYTPLPFRPGRGGFGDLFRTHLFVNAGNLTNIDTSDHWKASLIHLAQTLRVAYGAGVVMKLGGVARLEVNYCVPVVVQQGDSLCKGLQFGVGISFL